MAKSYFDLGGDYQGLRARRLNQVGRVVLYEIINNPPLYWFVTIKAFDHQHDLVLVGLKWGNGNWRFTSKKDAEKKFEEISSIIPRE